MQNNKITLIALDPATCTGWAVFECDAEYRNEQLLDYGKFIAKNKEGGKLADIAKQIGILCREHAPSEAIFERAGVPYRGRRINIQTFSIYTQAVGAVESALRLQLGDDNVFGCYPQTWKASEKKERTIKRMNLIWGLELEYKDNDIADAIGIGTWYFGRKRSRSEFPPIDKCTF